MCAGLFCDIHFQLTELKEFRAADAKTASEWKESFLAVLEERPGGGRTSSSGVSKDGSGGDSKDGNKEQDSAVAAAEIAEDEAADETSQKRGKASKAKKAN